MIAPREMGSKTPMCSCVSDVETEREDDCPIHASGTAREQAAAASVREIGS